MSLSQQLSIVTFLFFSYYFKTIIIIIFYHLFHVEKPSAFFQSQIRRKKNRFHLAPLLNF